MEPAGDAVADDPAVHRVARPSVVSGTAVLLDQGDRPVAQSINGTRSHNRGVAEVVAPGAADRYDITWLRDGPDGAVRHDDKLRTVGVVLRPDGGEAVVLHDVPTVGRVGIHAPREVHPAHGELDALPFELTPGAGKEGDQVIRAALGRTWPAGNKSAPGGTEAL